ncbi:caspase domain-containing protein [Leptolyngbyaceae cyanobacterium UHCC 1019]
MKQWAILIGIDKYQSFQPLNCAQQDVQALHHFLVSEAGFPLNQCLSFTELSPFLAGRSTYPNRENLCNWIEFLAQNYFQPDDQVWIFFNGYGVCHRGQDYFVPIDGNPGEIEATCIAIAPLLKRLKTTLPTGQPLVLLDINRSQATISHETVGIQTAQIAHQIGIPTILSCQPGQFSREISSLGHGLFTAALLEGLRYQQGATLATLSHYLSDRLPELSEHYWQPSQHPVTICPPPFVHQPLLSIAASTSAASTWNRASTNGHTSQSATETHSPEIYSTINTLNSNTLNSTAAFTLPTANVPSQTHSASQNKLTSNPFRPLDQPLPLPNYSTERESLENSYRQATPSTAATASVPTPTLDAIEPEPIEEIPLWRPFVLWGSLVSGILLSAVLWRNWSAVLAAPPSQQVPVAQLAEQPPEQRVASFNSSVSQSVPQQNDFRGKAILQSARLLVRSNQATPYRDAIQQARQIQVNDWAYQEAQQDIADWNQIIYTIAQERASRNQFDIAVMAADLVSLEDKKLRPQADAAIAQWCSFLSEQNGKSFQQPVKSSCEKFMPRL